MNLILIEDGTPIYLQIVDQIQQMITDGTLLDGAGLPSERKLSEELNVSRGTVTKAYDQLEKEQLIVRVKGKGCFVTRDQSYLSLDRKEKAIKLIKDMIRGMDELGFTLSETRVFTEIVLMEQEKKYQTIRIAIVDCSLEALHAIKAQIGSLKDVKIKLFLLDTIELNMVQSDIMSMDLIITTYTHYKKVVETIHDIDDKLVRVSMSPSKKTFIEIGRIRKGASIGLLYETDKFKSIMLKGLRDGDIEPEEDQAFCLSLPKEKILEGIRHKEIVIIPPLSFFDSSFAKWLMRHLENKPFIEFEYRIERGNFLLLEERIRQLMIMK